MFAHLPPLNSLKAFEAAARLHSFTDAALELSLTQGAVSYQVRKLEAFLGVELFTRSVRQVRLTHAGERFYNLTHRLLRELNDEAQRVAAPRGEAVLTLSVSTYFVTRWLSARMGQFLTEEPDITLRLQHSVNDPDFTIDEVDVAIRWGAGVWPGMDSELLLRSPMLAFCAPGLLGSGNTEERLARLSEQTFLHDQPATDSWREWLAAAGRADLGAGRGPVIVDPNVRVQSAIDGQGLVLANRLLNDEIENGRLEVAVDITLTRFGYYLVYHPRALERRPIRAFREWVHSAAERFDRDSPPRSPRA